MIIIDYEMSCALSFRLFGVAYVFPAVGVCDEGLYVRGSCTIRSDDRAY
jgi:hypothetical protein